jgi:hypothetical protein
MVRRALLIVTATLTLVAVGLVPDAPAGAASTAQTNPYQVIGDVVQDAVNVPPNVDGLTGGFVVGNVTASYGNVNPAKDSNGNLTIYTKSDTKYYKCDANGQNCRPSTAPIVVANGNRVQVAGRYYITNGQYTLVANYIWSPPKAPAPPPPPPAVNPAPASPRDYLNQNLFGVQAKVVGTKVDALGGFQLGNFTDYGCGTTPNCKVQRVAAAHHDRINVDPTNATTYWLSTDGGCNYRKTSDYYTVIYRVGVQQGLMVTGRYTWGGLDWVFTATNIFGPARSTTCGPNPSNGGPLTLTSALDRTDPGAYNPVADSWENSQWRGENGPGDFGGGPAEMELSWQQVPGGWEFWGTYKVSALPPQMTSIAGEIHGMATAPAFADVQWTINAQVTIDQTAGKWAGWSGSGSYSGTATFLSPSDPMPPFHQSGTFNWTISPG